MARNSKSETFFHQPCLGLDLDERVSREELFRFSTLSLSPILYRIGCSNISNNSNNWGQCYLFQPDARRRSRRRRRRHSHCCRRRLSVRNQVMLLWRLLLLQLLLLEPPSSPHFGIDCCFPLVLEAAQRDLANSSDATKVFVVAVVVPSFLFTAFAPNAPEKNRSAN